MTKSDAIVEETTTPIVVVVVVSTMIQSFAFVVRLELRRGWRTKRHPPDPAMIAAAGGATWAMMSSSFFLGFVWW